MPLTVAGGQGTASAKLRSKYGASVLAWCALLLAAPAAADPAVAATRSMDNSYLRILIPGNCTGPIKKLRMPPDADGVAISSTSIYCGSFYVLVQSGSMRGPWHVDTAQQILKRDLERQIKSGMTVMQTRTFNMRFPMTDGARSPLLPVAFDMGVIKKEGLAFSDLVIIQYNPANVRGGFCMHLVSILFEPDRARLAVAVIGSAVLDADSSCKFALLN